MLLEGVPDFEVTAEASDAREALAAVTTGRVDVLVLDLNMPGEPFEVLSHGHVVRGHFWGTGPVVYLVHGWGGSFESTWRRSGFTETTSPMKATSA